MDEAVQGAIPENSLKKLTGRHSRDLRPGPASTVSPGKIRGRRDVAAPGAHPIPVIASEAKQSKAASAEPVWIASSLRSSQ
jgi:hypothetical protein